MHAKDDQVKDPRLMVYGVYTMLYDQVKDQRLMVSREQVVWLHIVSLEAA